ncbi:MAG: hypothetical protein ABW185_03790 [Sedimenticola sp.]
MSGLSSCQRELDDLDETLKQSYLRKLNLLDEARIEDKRTGLTVEAIKTRLMRIVTEQHDIILRLEVENARLTSLLAMASAGPSTGRI